MSKLVRHVSDLTEQDFLDHPVWTWAEEEDESLVQPIHELEPLPECHDALFVAARFTLGNGRLLNGTVAVRCRDQQVYLLELFVGQDAFDLPLQNQKGFLDGLQKLASALGISSEQVAPIHYETNYRFAGKSHVSGVVLGSLDLD